MGSDGKCGIPPECSTWNDSNTKTCEAFKDQDGNKKCKYDKNSKKCEPKPPPPTPAPTPVPDQCGQYTKKECKKRSDCEYVADTCQVKQEKTPSPTEAPTPATKKDCEAIKDEKKCKDNCIWDKNKSKCFDGCTTYAAYQKRVQIGAEKVKKKPDKQKKKECEKYGGLYDSKKKTCTAYQYDKNEKGGKTDKFKCKKIKDEDSCSCLNNKCKMKVKKRRRSSAKANNSSNLTSMVREFNLIGTFALSTTTISFHFNFCSCTAQNSFLSLCDALYE